MKTILIPFADFAAIDGPLTREQWTAWFLAHGVDPKKVVRRHYAEDQKADIYEVED
jgi:hypothetical protein